MRERSLVALSTFLAVAERQSFSAAGAALGISRSAVSQAVRALEDQLGAPLLVRTTRSVRLTDAGRPTTHSRPRRAAIGPRARCASQCPISPCRL